MNLYRDQPRRLTPVDFQLSQLIVMLLRWSKLLTQNYHG